MANFAEQTAALRALHLRLGHAPGALFARPRVDPIKADTGAALPSPTRVAHANAAYGAAVALQIAAIAEGPIARAAIDAAVFSDRWDRPGAHQRAQRPAFCELAAAAAAAGLRLFSANAATSPTARASGGSMKNDFCRFN
jgi:hypothetical protein